MHNADVILPQKEMNVFGLSFTYTQSIYQMIYVWVLIVYN